MTEGVTYTTKNWTGWNETRRGEIELDALARLYLGDPQITDRDRIAFALRELRHRGYAIEDPMRSRYSTESSRDLDQMIESLRRKLGLAEALITFRESYYGEVSEPEATDPVQHFREVYRRLVSSVSRQGRA